MRDPFIFLLRGRKAAIARLAVVVQLAPLFYNCTTDTTRGVFGAFGEGDRDVFQSADGISVAGGRSSDRQARNRLQPDEGFD